MGWDGLDTWVSKLGNSWSSCVDFSDRETLDFVSLRMKKRERAERKTYVSCEM